LIAINSATVIPSSLPPPQVTPEFLWLYLLCAHRHDYLFTFLGRINPKKEVVEAIDGAHRTGRRQIIAGPI